MAAVPETAPGSGAPRTAGPPAATPAGLQHHFFIIINIEFVYAHSIQPEIKTDSHLGQQHLLQRAAPPGRTLEGEPAVQERIVAHGQRPPLHYRRQPAVQARIHQQTNISQLPRKSMLLPDELRIDQNGSSAGDKLTQICV